MKKWRRAWRPLPVYTDAFVNFLGKYDVLVGASRQLTFMKLSIIFRREQRSAGRPDFGGNPAATRALSTIRKVIDHV
jgi:hypothetical protein